MSTRQKALASLLLFLCLWLPRSLQLDHFVAVDERSWLTRAGNFYLALSRGDWAGTYQRYHPGVTTMWLGMAGYLWRYPDYAAEAPEQVESMNEGVEDFLRAHGRDPMALLAAGRLAVVTVIALALVVAFWLAVDLVGLATAAVGFLLIALEPFFLGLSRMLHVDGLSSTFMFLSLLAFLRYQQRGRRGDLILSGVVAGLAWLTKSPAFFLIPFVGLLALTQAARERFRLPVLRKLAMELGIWGGLGVGVFFLLWPAMWVQPLAAIRDILSAAGESAAEGHSKAIYFNGRVIDGDPGPLFYPLTYLWRTTPVVMIGLILALWTAVRREPAGRSPFAVPGRRRTAGLLALYVLAFTAFMTLGSKKFPRYLIPAYLPLDLLAALGWVGLAAWLQERLPTIRRRWIAAGLPALAVALQAALALPHFPYYFTYYNPLLGGSAKAPEVMMIGLGEGLDQAARYLMEKPQAERLTVASWYRGGSFSYIFPYRSVDIEEFYRADYAVLYAHQWQRQVPDRRLLDYFAGLPPERVITLHGTEYVRIYNLHTVPPPTYFTDWGHAIRLVDHEILEGPVQPGRDFVVRLRLYTLAPLAENLSVVVRLVDQAGNEVARSEGWPYGSPTSTWQSGEVYVDGHKFRLPDEASPGYYRIEVAFYEPDSQELLTPTVAGTDTPRPTFLPIDYLSVGKLPYSPTLMLRPPADLGETIRLVGADVEGPETPAPGTSLKVVLFWKQRSYNQVDYTVFIHLIGPDGQTVAQFDSQPLGGFVPTSLWHDGEIIIDPHVIQIPADAPSGPYHLRLGLYELATLQRLPVRMGDEPRGDSVDLVTFMVQ
ncbi:MAG: hypothetical protein KatS3mg050_0074 [Litorilinea sp.]|nr:MAG: hypothetical protein KatS3mg050_0074 [Litorilinea sp.]